MYICMLFWSILSFYRRGDFIFWVNVNITQPPFSFGITCGLLLFLVEVLSILIEKKMAPGDLIIGLFISSAVNSNRFITIVVDKPCA